MIENNSVIIETIDGIILKKLSLRKTRLHHWFLDRIKTEKKSIEDLASLFGVEIGTIRIWMKKEYSFKNCELISNVTGIPEAELIIELGGLKKAEESSKIEEISEDFSKYGDKILNHMTMSETRFWDWYKKETIGSTQVEIAQRFNLGVNVVNKWRNRCYTYKDCELIAKETGIPEATLLIELVALRKFLNINIDNNT